MVACKKCGGKKWIKLPPIKVAKSNQTYDSFELRQFKCLGCKTIQSEQKFRTRPRVLSQ